MIVEIIFDALFFVINGLLNFLPVFTIPSDFLNSIGGIIELLAIVGHFMPIGVLQVALTVFVLFHGLEFVISIINWLIAKIPTIE